jgi:hypothetical protein
MSENDIKRLMKHLGESINETLAESPKINERIQEIRDSGYDVFLVIEAKIGFSRKEKEEDAASSEDASSEDASSEDAASQNEPVRLKITPDDAKFLKSLKISADNL